MSFLKQLAYEIVGFVLYIFLIIPIYSTNVFTYDFSTNTFPIEDPCD